MDEEREKEWHEEAPRIIASGRWEQDEYGDTTYIPDHVRPSTAERAETADASRGHYYEDPAPRDGYRVRSETTWAAARRDYLAGDTAEAVCDRYGLKLGTLRSRAAREGWVIATAKAEAIGRTTQVWTIRVEEEGGKLVCLSRITLAVIAVQQA